MSLKEYCILEISFHCHRRARLPNCLRSVPLGSASSSTPPFWTASSAVEFPSFTPDVHAALPQASIPFASLSVCLSVGTHVCWGFPCTFSIFHARVNAHTNQTLRHTCAAPPSAFLTQILALWRLWWGRAKQKEGLCSEESEKGGRGRREGVMP